MFASKLLLSCATLSASLMGAHAIVANSEPTEMVVNGQTVSVVLEGGPFNHFLSVNGNLVAYNKQDELVYVEVDDAGEPALTNLLVGVQDENVPSSSKLRPKLEDPEPVFSGRTLQEQVDYAKIFREELLKATKENPFLLNNLVILLRFSDHIDRPIPPRESYDVLFNSITPEGEEYPEEAPTGSIKEIYLENSVGKLQVDSTVIGWCDVPFTEAECASGDRVNEDLYTRYLRYEVLHQAMRYCLTQNEEVQKLNFQDFDSNKDGQIDMITFVHSGYDGAAGGGDDMYGTKQPGRVWSHKWNLFKDVTFNLPTFNDGPKPIYLNNAVTKDNVTVDAYNINPGNWELEYHNITRKAVVGHEMGHFLRLPDFYDRDSTSAGLGLYGLMANSWGWSGEQRHAQHMSAYSKEYLGFTKPTVLTSADNGKEFTVMPAETHDSAYKITEGFADGEYILIENRQAILNDQEFLNPGLFVFHIDENVGRAQNDVESIPGVKAWPEYHYFLRTVQHDQLYEMESRRQRGFRSVDYEDYEGDSLSKVGHKVTSDYTTGGLNSYTYETVNCMQQGANSNKAIEVVRVEPVDATKPELGNKITFKFTSSAPTECDLTLKTEPPTPFPEDPNPTPYPTPEFYDDIAAGNGCVDHADYLDGESVKGGTKYDCAWYAADSFPAELLSGNLRPGTLSRYTRCNKFGSLHPDVTTGATAIEACCVCGSRTSTDPSDPQTPTSSPTLSPTSSPTAPTGSPTGAPTNSPTFSPTDAPTADSSFVEKEPLSGLNTLLLVLILGGGGLFGFATVFFHSSKKRERVNEDSVDNFAAFKVDSQAEEF